MSPKKLTEEDKKEILKLYRHSEATTSTLATQYGVSSSTISRFLKGHLSATEYEDLIQQKRLARTPAKSNSATEEKTDYQADQKQIQSPTVVLKKTETKKKEPQLKVDRSDSRSSTAPVTSVSPSDRDIEDQDKIDQLSLKINEQSNLEEEIDDVEVDLLAIGAMLGEDIADLDDDDDELDDEDDDWEAETDHEINYPHAGSGNVDVKILPLSAASLPKICYIVVDRAAELIARPLEDFADLGTIPAEEVQQQTLPIFDNHRVARRFSHRRERVIKVPDGRMLQKTSTYLQAKGITRLLIDGQVYSLSKT